MVHPQAMNTIVVDYNNIYVNIKILQTIQGDNILETVNICIILIQVADKENI